MTSDSDQLDYDMSNRAQLPRGIENIRPHLETMDNVPLLVSLFTDCVPATTKEMLKIMQVSVYRLGVGIIDEGTYASGFERAYSLYQGFI